ncbi:MAG: tripartite tricarboxylate transporter substrate binding protein [Armatimonadota bacterium]|nr:MAG: tripartite tricarboxylate transporter substrate binding protein [Armatimonadota bacterium]
MRVLGMVVLCLVVALAGCAGGGPKEFPSSRITVICPPAPGGISDTLTRSLASAAQEALDVPVTVINKPGASGAIGLRAGASAEPDGYTVTYVIVEVVILPHLGYEKIGYENFDLLMRTNLSPAAVSVQKGDRRWKDLKSFIAYAKAHPGEVSVGNSGTGAIWHLAALALEKETGAKFNHVPYQGSGPAVQDLMGKHIDAVMSGASEVQVGLDAGKVEMLALLADDRSEYFPEVPTAKEQGVDVSIGAWGGLGVPKGTPDDARAALLGGFKQAYDSEQFTKVMERRAISRAWLGAEDFTQFAREQQAYFGELIEEFGIKPQAAE